MNEWVSGEMNRWMNGQTGEWMDRWDIDGLDFWLDGHMKEQAEGGQVADAGWWQEDNGG